MLRSPITSTGLLFVCIGIGGSQHGCTTAMHQRLTGAKH